MNAEEMVALMEYWRTHLSSGLLMELSYVRKGCFLAPSAIFMINGVSNLEPVILGGLPVDDILCSINILWTNGGFFGGGGKGSVRISTLINNPEFLMSILVDFRACRDTRIIPKRIASLIATGLTHEAASVLSNNRILVDSNGDPSVAIQRISTLFPTGFTRKSGTPKKKKVTESFKRRSRRLKIKKDSRLRAAARREAVGSFDVGSADVELGPPVPVMGLNPRYVNGRSSFWTTQYVIDHIPSVYWCWLEQGESSEGYLGCGDTVMLSIPKRHGASFHNGTLFNGDFVADTPGWHAERLTRGYDVYVLNGVNILSLAGLISYDYPRI